MSTRHAKFVDELITAGAREGKVLTELRPFIMATAAANGLATTLELPPLEVRHDLRAPVVSARIVGRWVAWTTTDEGTPWLELRVVLRQGARVLTADLGRHAPSGDVDANPLHTAPVG